MYSVYYLGYDDKSNLFVDGETSYTNGAFIYGELQKAGNSVTTIALNQTIGFPGPIQWDGKHIAIGDIVVCALRPPRAS